jgi:hypothetical protein
MRIGVWCIPSAIRDNPLYPIDRGVTRGISSQESQWPAPSVKSTSATPLVWNGRPSSSVRLTSFDPAPDTIVADLGAVRAWI